MSNYLNNRSLFMEPEVKQYGNHMVMTNTVLPTKKKYLNIDTRYSDDFDLNKGANYNITMPEKINSVKSMRARCAEIPITFYNISSDLGNNVFLLSDGTTSFLAKLSNKFYDSVELENEVNAILTAAPSPFSTVTYQIVDGKSVFTNGGGSQLQIQFDISESGALDVQNLTYKLGWMMGYRETEYSLQPADAKTSEAGVDMHLPKYLFLVINEFQNGNPYSFVTFLQHSEINSSQVLARIVMNYREAPYGTVLTCNEERGTLLSDKRIYEGPINLLRMNIQIVNERGVVMNLNGIDFSFCLELEYE